MGYSLKSFCEIPELANNTPNNYSVIGELSQYSLSYSKDITSYKSSSGRCVIRGFSSKDASGTVAVPTNVLVILDSLVDKLYTGFIANQVGQDKTIAEDYLRTQLNMSNVVLSFGAMISFGNTYVPEYVRLKINDYLNGDNQIVVWLCDNSFKQQYDEYQIDVISPIESLDGFFDTYESVKTQVESQDYKTKISRLNAVKGEDLTTKIDIQSFYYINGTNRSLKILTDWTLLIYGEAGINLDVIKDAIKKYILDNSTHTEEEWRVIFPDIFKKTEFLILPNWKSVALPETSLDAGIYSNLLKVGLTITKLKNYLLGKMTSVFIDTYCEVMSHPYRSLQCLVIGTPDNRDNLYSISSVYPDMIDESNTTLDFQRQSLKTKQLLSKLAVMIPLAESMNEFTILPDGYKRVKRDNILYITTSLDGISFLVTSKLTNPL